MECINELDWMLEEAKASPMAISHDFETRFRVWTRQILPARMRAINGGGNNIDHILRMTQLLTDDMRRLRRRALIEGMDEYDRRVIFLSMIFFTSIESYTSMMVETRREQQ